MYTKLNDNSSKIKSVIKISRIDKSLNENIMYGLFWWFFVWSQPFPDASGKVYNLEVDTSDVRNSLPHFWKSTGFCPPLPHAKAYDFDYGLDMKHNLALIGSVAHGGIEQVRIHWLLDLVTIDTIKQGKPVYNYTKLDDLTQFLFENRLKPGFELMGSPPGFFNDFENKTQVYMWRDFIQDLSQYFVDEYGISEVMTWNFETWNEPDCRDFDKVKMTVQGFLNYYDACSEGLKATSKLIQFGGPAAGCDWPGHSSYADSLLDHVVNGENYFTGEKGVRIDFLSYHRKGEKSSQTILKRETTTVQEIKRKYPSLANKPFYNDEADPLVGWSRDESWRADATYAAMVAKVIAQHQNMFISNSNSPVSNYTLLSNDNAFLSWYPYQFTERTLTARFQMNNTKPPHVQFIKKPIHSVMSLLSLLGDQQVKADLMLTNHIDQSFVISNDSDIGVIASVHTPDDTGSPDSWQAAVLIYQSMDTKSDSGVINNVQLKVYLRPPNPNATEVIAVGYTISNADETNPYSIWKHFGSPKFPTDTQFISMRSSEGPMKTFNKTIRDFDSPSTFKIDMKTPEIILVHFCAMANSDPDQVNNIVIYNVTVGKILITWSDACVNTKCISTYEILFNPRPTGVIYRINKDDTIVTSFYFTLSAESDAGLYGTYRIRAVDYWGRLGPLSLPVNYGPIHS